MINSAIFSACGKFRYLLERNIEDGLGLIVLWIMVNPSTADAFKDDPTLRRVIGFTKLFAGSVALVGNLYALINPDVRGLKSATDPIGPENLIHLEKMIQEPDMVIYAWGSSAKMPDDWSHRIADIDQIMKSYPDKGPFVIGYCKDGQPRHPLMAPYRQPERC